MAIKPILFNTEMVRAILDGRKTCTRRIVKPQPTAHYGAQCIKPPYQPGDILYVRETWCLRYDGEKYFYKADKNTPREEKRLIDYNNTSWHPSIHMPKEAARIWLKVTSVRVERLHEITEDGALREGSQGIRCDHVALGEHGCTDCMNTGWIEPPQVEFMQIWDSTIKKSDLDRYGWDANPYVWVISFERCEKPEKKETWTTLECHSNGRWTEGMKAGWNACLEGQLSKKWKP